MKIRLCVSSRVKIALLITNYKCWILIDSFRLVTDSELKQLHTSWVDEYGKLVMRNETTRTRRACETVKVTSRQRHPMNKKSMNPR